MHGTFVKGEAHGKGKFFMEDGTPLKVEYDHGKSFGKVGVTSTGMKKDLGGTLHDMF